MTENLITEQYKEDTDYINNDTIIGLRKINPRIPCEDLDSSYRSSSNIKMNEKEISNDSVIVINEENKNPKESSSKKRRYAHHRKSDISINNPNLKKLFKRRENDNDIEDKGRCSRCQIL